MRAANGMRHGACGGVGALSIAARDDAFDRSPAALSSLSAHAACRTHRVPDTIGVPHIHVGRTPHVLRRHFGGAV
jgi:hypothetical protein